MNTGLSDKESQGMFSTIDTEEKQLQAINDLYAIAIAQPKYAALKNKQWSGDESPVVVLNWLLKKLGALANGEQWLIDTYQHRGKQRYSFAMYRTFSSYVVRGGHQYLTLDFLPYLKKRDRALHDLIIDVVALVSKNNRVPLWDEDGDFSEVLQQLLDDRFMTGVMYRGRVDTYQAGQAHHYLQVLHDRKSSVTIEDVARGIHRYKDGSQRVNSILWWVKKGLRLAEIDQCIDDSTFIPGYEKEADPFRPYHQYKFVWSRKDRDPVYRGAMNKLERMKRKVNYNPVEFGITKPGKPLRPIVRDEFPEMLDEFMHNGWRLFTSTFKDYFYKKQIRDYEDGIELTIEHTTTLLEMHVLNML